MPAPGLRPGARGGSRICDGRLVCPFHGYEFDATGQCVATPFADPPKTAKLRVFETREVLGLIFAWWGIGGRPPQWSLPPDPPDEEGWSDFEIWTTRFPGHPQETASGEVSVATLLFRGEALTPGGLSQMDALIDAVVSAPSVGELLAPVNPIVAPATLIGAALQVDDFESITQAQIDSARNAPEIQRALAAMTGTDADGTPVAIANLRLIDTGDERVADAERRINELAVGDEGPLRVSSLSPVVVEDEYKKATEEGMAPLIGLALLLIAVLLLLFTRTLSDMLLTLAGLVFALTWIVGAEGWIQTEGDVP